MKIPHLFIATLTAFMILAAACAPQATPTQAPATQAPATQAPPAQLQEATASAPTGAPPATSAPTTVVTPATPTGPATVNVANNSKYGSILTDANGMTLYVFLNDTSTTSTCSGACASLWPALLTNGNPIAGNGVDGTKLGTTTRADGSVQVTYNGHPLYYYAKDSAAGDTNGQGIKNVWYVVSPTGDPIKQ
jgi:predicted lipoprotein with Yx(FWY)xxD motif